MRIWNSKLIANIVQAIARDILAEAMMRLDALKFRIVLTAHDEILCEVSKTETCRFEEFVTTMQMSPTWCKGLPITVNGWMGDYYKK